MTLSDFQLELAVAAYEPQRRYRQGDWTFDSTIWSRATYTLARRHGKLRPSPARGRHNLERRFEARLARAAARLVTLGMAEWRSVGGPDAPARFAQGYKRHKSRTRDLLLTEAGLEAVESHLRSSGLMPHPILASCEDAPLVTGPIAADEGSCD